MQGYDNPKTQSKESFLQQVDIWTTHDEYVLFGVFCRENDLLCGYADVYLWGKYMPISSLKTRPSYERSNVNFALVYGIVEHYKEELGNGAYLCDGSRHVLHETNFQDFLIKYFNFRKSYCNLKVEYRGIFKYAVYLLFPFRDLIKKLNIKKLTAVLRLHAWSKGIDWN